MGKTSARLAEKRVSLSVSEPERHNKLCAPFQVLLKTDSSWLMKSEASREKPTIPCFLLFVIHVQQQELGGFTLPNDMYKWTKMR